MKTIEEYQNALDFIVYGYVGLDDAKYEISLLQELIDKLKENK